MQEMLFPVRQVKAKRLTGWESDTQKDNQMNFGAEREQFS